MLTGKPPLSHLEPDVAKFKTASEPLNIAALLPQNVSLDAKEFIMAALEWLVLYCQYQSYWLCS